MRKNLHQNCHSRACGNPISSFVKWIPASAGMTGKSRNSSNGFTIAEILVVMAIVAVVGTIMVVVFTNTLRGSNKSQMISAIKQNGQAVLDNMDKTIRNADDLVCFPISPPGNTIVVVQNGIYTRYRIVFPDTVCADLVTETDGCIVQDHPTKQTDPNTLQLETDPVFRNNVCSSSDPMPRSGSSDHANILTDTNLRTGVKIDSGSFTASKPGGYQAVISINFVLKPGVEAPESIAGQVDPITFQTSVGLR